MTRCQQNLSMVVAINNPHGAFHEYERRTRESWTSRWHRMTGVQPPIAAKAKVRTSGLHKLQLSPYKVQSKKQIPVACRAEIDQIHANRPKNRTKFIPVNGASLKYRPHRVVMPSPDDIDQIFTGAQF